MLFRMEIDCQRFQGEIVDIAESGRRYSPALSHHIGVCLQCREFLLEQLVVNALWSESSSPAGSHLVKVAEAVTRPNLEESVPSSRSAQSTSAKKLTGFEASRWIIWAGVIASYLIATATVAVALVTSKSVTYNNYLIALTGLLPALLTTVIAVASYVNEKISYVRYLIVGLGGVVLLLTGVFSYQSHLSAKAEIDYLPIVITFIAFAYRDHLSYKVQVVRSLELFRSTGGPIEIEDNGGRATLDEKRSPRGFVSYLSSGTVLRPVVALVITLALLVEVGLATATPNSKSFIFSTPVSKTIPIATTHHSCSGSRPMQL